MALPAAIVAARAVHRARHQAVRLRAQAVRVHRAAAIAAAAAAVYVIISKIKAKNAPQGYDEDNYVSCSCLDEDFISETVAE